MKAVATSIPCTILSLMFIHRFSVPHPSENHIHLRIQMYGMPLVLLSEVQHLNSCIDNLSSLDALLQALENLDNLCETVENAYHTSLSTNSYERWSERS